METKREESQKNIADIDIETFESEVSLLLKTIPRTFGRDQVINLFMDSINSLNCGVYLDFFEEGTRESDTIVEVATDSTLYARLACFVKQKSSGAWLDVLHTAVDELALIIESNEDELPCSIFDQSSDNETSESFNSDNDMDRFRFHSNLPCGVLIQSSNGQILYINGRLEKYLNISTGDAVGKYPRHVIHSVISQSGSVLSEAEYPPSVAIRTKKEITGIVIGVKRSDTDDTKWFVCNSRPTKCPNGNKDIVLTIMINITDKPYVQTPYFLTVNESVNTILQIIELKDPSLVAHHRRVAHLSGRLGEFLDLDKHELLSLRIAANLHDIGKLYLPDSMRHQISNFTNDEIILFKKHPLVGYDILKNIALPDRVAVFVFQHHEKLDGSGYPMGLDGGQITMGAKIIAVANAMENLVSSHPYQRAVGIVEALDVIDRKSNMLYDQSVVNACRELFLDHEYEFPESVPHVNILNM